MPDRHKKFVDDVVMAVSEVDERLLYTALTESEMEPREIAALSPQIMDQLRTGKGITHPAEHCDMNGDTILHYAAGSGHGYVLDYLIALQMSEAQCGDHQAESDMIARIINSSNSEGNTPLHDAVKKQRVQTLALLVRFGADASRKNKAGETPKGLAKKLSRTSVEMKEAVDILHGGAKCGSC